MWTLYGHHARVEEVADAFGEDVQLLAINIQESKAKVEAATRRLELSSQVLLDQQGAVAALYEANAIPQTVVIDRAGRVRKVFVGGGSQVLDALHVAIEDAVAEPIP